MVESLEDVADITALARSLTPARTGAAR
jgi:hypothetical protein